MKSKKWKVDVDLLNKWHTECVGTRRKSLITYASRFLVFVERFTHTYTLPVCVRQPFST